MARVGVKVGPVYASDKMSDGTCGCLVVGFLAFAVAVTLGIVVAHTHAPTGVEIRHGAVKALLVGVVALAAIAGLVAALVGWARAMSAEPADEDDEDEDEDEDEEL